MAVTLDERYVASMVLGGVGDALGYKGGDWEFCTSGEKIHAEVSRLRGVACLDVRLPQWNVSDDTVLHMATGRALLRNGNSDNKDELCLLLAEEYKKCMSDMEGRSPGKTCVKSCRKLDPWDSNRKGYQLPFNPQGGGCGAAIRSMCIGLRYPRPEQLADLVEVAIESGRMTHHHPTGYLGSLASALFTSYAIQGVPLREWGMKVVDVLPIAFDLISSKPERFAVDNQKTWDYFHCRWLEYLRTRNIANGKTDPYFPPKYNVRMQDDFYRYLSYDGWGGSSGHDAPMIAYDGLLSCHGNWEELCKRSMFHGGDSDSTGTIAGSLYGAMYGFSGVPEKNHKHVEYRKEMKEIGKALYKLSNKVRAETMV